MMYLVPHQFQKPLSRDILDKHINPKATGKYGSAATLLFRRKYCIDQSACFAKVCYIHSPFHNTEGIDTIDIPKPQNRANAML
jgi:hypothetical protein